MGEDGPQGPSVSYTSFGTFDECPRRWLYSYACDHLPGSPVWPVIQQKQLAPWETFAGKIVDSVVSASLLQFKRSGYWPEQPRKMALAAASEAWTYSHEWVQAVASRRTWPPGPKGIQPLDRHYYREPFTDTEKHDIRQKVTVSVENFFDSDVRRFIQQIDTHYWHGPRAPEDSLPWYRLGEVPVWAVYDFAIETPDLVYLIDWKCGKLTGESYSNAIEQLHWYALHAVVEWQVAAERIRLMPVWLYPEVVTEQVTVDEDDLKALESNIVTRHQLLLNLLHMDEGGRVAVDEWPLTEKTWHCKRCQFRGACEGAQRIKPPAPVGSSEAVEPLAVGSR